MTTSSAPKPADSHTEMDGTTATSATILHTSQVKRPIARLPPRPLMRSSQPSSSIIGPSAVETQLNAVLSAFKKESSEKDNLIEQKTDKEAELMQKLQEEKGKVQVLTTEGESLKRKSDQMEATVDVLLEKVKAAERAHENQDGNEVEPFKVREEALVTGLQAAKVLIEDLSAEIMSGKDDHDVLEIRFGLAEERNRSLRARLSEAQTEKQLEAAKVKIAEENAEAHKKRFDGVVVKLQKEEEAVKRARKEVQDAVAKCKENEAELHKLRSQIRELRKGHNGTGEVILIE